jgi:hypothetical protein
MTKELLDAPSQDDLKNSIVNVVLSGRFVGGNAKSVYKLAGPGFQVLAKKGSEVFDTVEEAVDFFLAK